jgi:hypothetical protein
VVDPYCRLRFPVVEPQSPVVEPQFPVVEPVETSFSSPSPAVEPVEAPFLSPAFDFDKLNHRWLLVVMGLRWSSLSRPRSCHNSGGRACRDLVLVTVSGGRACRDPPSLSPACVISTGSSTGGCGACPVFRWSSLSKPLSPRPRVISTGSITGNSVSLRWAGLPRPRASPARVISTGSITGGCGSCPVFRWSSLSRPLCALPACDFDKLNHRGCGLNHWGRLVGSEANL